MAVHYAKALFGRIKRAGLRPVTIDCGGGIVWQGGVDETTQFDLIALISRLRKEFPDEEIPRPGESLADRDARLATLTIPGMESVEPKIVPAAIPAEPGTNGTTAKAKKPKRKTGRKPR